LDFNSSPNRNRNKTATWPQNELIYVNFTGHNSNL